MTGILKEIVEYKREFVNKSKLTLPLKDIEELAIESEGPRDFTEALIGKECALIAEIKTASPSKGIIRDNVAIEDVARIYSENGAACISVLTDEKYFMGTLSRLEKIRKTVYNPILRKDFIIDVYQIYESRFAGADSILLIAACLGDSQLLDFIEVASLLDLDCLVEVHDEIEMNRISKLNAKLIGINNRDLQTFQTDISVTGKLAKLAPPGAILVSESGINNVGDVKSVHSMGANAVLVGESLMRAHDIGEKVREFTNID
ncbi:indole-3-glycerol phosphate synthase TrpC [Candidatus Latescibacterota bacterium]